MRDRYYTPDAVFHGPTVGEVNRDQFEQFATEGSTALQWISFSIDDMIAEGDRVAIRYTGQRKHTGTYVGVPAAGKRIIDKGVEIYRVKQGKIFEMWAFPDRLGTMTQLGAIPAPKK